MSQSLPTLSTAGYVQDPAQILDTLLSYFFIADYSQSNEHYGKVASLPYLIKENTNDMQRLKNRCHSALTNLLDAYYENVSISVDVVENTNDLESYDIRLMGEVMAKGKTYSVGKLISVANDKIAKTTNFNV